METKVRCPICHASDGMTILDHDDFPYFTVPVAKEIKRDILLRYQGKTLSSRLLIYACHQCGHCHLMTPPDREVLGELYSKYYTYPSPLKGFFQPERDLTFLKFFTEKIHPLYSEIRWNNLLEVGCYDGYILNKIREHGYSVTGCDPSDGAEIGRSYGLNILRRFFVPEDFSKEGSAFDIVLSRHFVEHVEEPRTWVKKLSQVMTPEGILILETPNVSYYLDQGLLEVFSLQHLHAFSRRSLMHILDASGMGVMMSFETPSNLIVVAQRGAVTSCGPGVVDDALVIGAFKKKLDENRGILRDVVQNKMGSEGGIALWGAGGFGLAALTLYGVPVDCAQFIIDSDPAKWGMEYLNLGIPIISPESAKQRSPNLIIITSMYSESIVKTIRAKGFSSSILTIFPKVSLLH